MRHTAGVFAFRQAQAASKPILPVSRMLGRPVHSPILAFTPCRELFRQLQILRTVR